MNAWGRAVAIDHASRLRRQPAAGTDRVMPNNIGGALSVDEQARCGCTARTRTRGSMLDLASDDGSDGADELDRWRRRRAPFLIWQFVHHQPRHARSSLSVG